MNTYRPLTVTIATVLLTLLSVFNLSALLIYPPNSPKLPGILYYGSIVFGVGGLIAVFGLWKLKRWSLLLTTILSALAILWVALFVVLYSSISGKVLPGVVTVFYVLVLVLVALPATRKAYAAARAPAEQQEAQP